MFLGSADLDQVTFGSKCLAFLVLCSEPGEEWDVEDHSHQIGWFPQRGLPTPRRGPRHPWPDAESSTPAQCSWRTILKGAQRCSPPPASNPCTVPEGAVMALRHSWDTQLGRYSRPAPGCGAVIGDDRQYCHSGLAQVEAQRAMHSAWDTLGPGPPPRVRGRAAGANTSSSSSSSFRLYASSRVVGFGRVTTYSRRART
jgi:hypothetical protein